MIRSLFLISMLAITHFAFSVQASNVDNDTVFIAKNYQQYLTGVAADFHASKTITFNKLCMLAIALEKTAAWDTDTGKQTRKLLTDVPNGLRDLDAFQKLLTGDMTGLQDLYANKATEPDYRSVVQSIRILREHGFPLAADALAAVCPESFGSRITAWINLPAEKRPVVNQLLLARYPANTPNRNAFISTALDMYQHPPEKSTVNPEAYLDFALWFGKDSPAISLDTARALLYAQKRAGAIKLARSLAWKGADDFITPRQVASFLITAEDYAGALEVYQRSLAAVHEPYTREIRLEYLEFLATSPPRDRHPKIVLPTLGAMQHQQDPLLAADALLTGKQYTDAARMYAVVFNDAAIPFPRRLAAWSGLLDGDPQAALTGTPHLLEMISAHDATTRGMEVRWLGWQLHRVANREVPENPGIVRPATRQAYLPIRQAQDWAVQLAAVMDRLIEIDAPAMLKKDEQWNNYSLRYSAGMIYALAGQNEKAQEILRRQITYQIPPPPGGWQEPGGLVMPDADKPRTVTSPQAGEAERLMKDLMAAMTRYTAAAKHLSPKDQPPSLAPLNTTLIAELAAKITTLHDQQDVKNQLRKLGEQVNAAVTALDPLPRVQRLDLPPPAPHDIDLAQFMPISAAIHDVLTSPQAAAESSMLIFYGLKPAMLTASNPQLLEELLALTMRSLDRYIEVTHYTDTAASYAASVSNSLEARPIYDMKPYAQRLRERYPKNAR